MPSSPTVLIVEDEDNLRSLYAEYLSDSFTVRTAGDGEQALLLLDEDVDVVLLDRRLPGMNGEEILEEIQEKGPIRVAMVTAVEPDFDIIEMDFDDYVTKPVLKEELNATVERLHELRTYDELMNEYFSLVQKHALLLAEKTRDEIEGSEEFQRLEEEIEQLEAEVDSVRDGLNKAGEVVIFDSPGNRRGSAD